MRVAVKYLPAGRTDTGGDFYGLAPLDDGRVAVFVGDVMGRGVQAASAMAQMRSAVRALLAVDPDPATVLAGLDKLFARFDIDQLVTLVYAVLDRERGRMHIINAGHPAPVLVPAQGPAEMIETEETLLLGAGGGPREVITHPLRDTDTLLLFTDGLAERRGEVIVEGYDRITVAAESLREPDLQASLDALVDAVRDPTRDDDVAALVIRAKTAFVSRLPSAERPDEVHDRWLLPSDERAAGVARRHLEAALSGLPSESVDTVRLLTSELVTNAIAHGSGLVAMTVDYDGTRVRVEVLDRVAGVAADQGVGGVESQCGQVHDVDAGGQGQVARPGAAVEQGDVEVACQPVDEVDRPHQVTEADRVLAVEEQPGPRHAGPAPSVAQRREVVRTRSSSARVPTSTRLTARTARSTSRAAAAYQRRSASPGGAS